jgi:signal transduction histidine kinase
LLKQRIAQTQILLAETMQAVHRFARELRPSMLDELGLLPALRSCLKGFAERTGTRARLNGRSGAEDLDDEQKTVLFRVTQESLTNVAKHAAATRVTVTFRRLAAGVRLQIKDNGRGFETDRSLARNGAGRLGLLGMAERLRLVNGRLTVTSAPGRGTTISAELPFVAAGSLRALATPSRGSRKSQAGS